MPEKMNHTNRHLLFTIIILTVLALFYFVHSEEGLTTFLRMRCRGVVFGDWNDLGSREREGGREEWYIAAKDGGGL